MAVNKTVCQKIGRIIKDVEFKPQRFVNFLADKEAEALFWFYVVGICHDTKSLEGTRDGKWLRGWDYLLAAFKREVQQNPDFLDPGYMRRIDEQDIARIFSDTGDGKTTMSGIDERVSLLRDLSTKLITVYRGDLNKIARITDGNIAGKKGLVSVLKDFEAYSDPLQKKTMVLLKFLTDIGYLVIKDPENAKMPIDYHMMRTAFRTGAVSINSGIFVKLLMQSPVTDDEHLLIRKTCQEAYSLISKHSGYSVFRLDDFFWNFGRNCCWEKPVCVNPCPKQDCGFTQTIVYDCSGKCILQSACIGAQNEIMRNLQEPNIKTHYY